VGFSAGAVQFVSVTGKPRAFQNLRTFTEHMIVKHVDEEDLVTVAMSLIIVSS
jgi:hypothetical protein